MDEYAISERTADFLDESWSLTANGNLKSGHFLKGYVIVKTEPGYSGNYWWGMFLGQKGAPPTESGTEITLEQAQESALLTLNNPLRDADIQCKECGHYPVETAGSICFYCEEEEDDAGAID